MRPEDEKNITYRRRRDRTSEPHPEQEEEVVLSEEEVEEEPHSKSDKGKGSMGDEYDARINILFHILNDLAKGQKMMMDLMGHLASNSLGGPTKQNKMGKEPLTMEKGATPEPLCKVTLIFTPNIPGL
jgi:hypothetical protein